MRRDEATRKEAPSTAHRDQVDQMKNASEKHASGRCLMSSSKHLVLRREPTKLLSPTGKLHFSDRNLGDMGGGDLVKVGAGNGPLIWQRWHQRGRGK